MQWALQENKWSTEKHVEKDVSRKAQRLGQVSAHSSVCLLRSSTSQYWIFTFRTAVWVDSQGPHAGLEGTLDKERYTGSQEHLSVRA